MSVGASLVGAQSPFTGEGWDVGKIPAPTPIPAINRHSLHQLTVIPAKAGIHTAAPAPPLKPRIIPRPQPPFPT